MTQLLLKWIKGGLLKKFRVELEVKLIVAISVWHTDGLDYETGDWIEDNYAIVN